MIVKIRTKDGYKVGLSRDFGIGLEDYEELLEETRYTELEAEERIKYWSEKLELEEFEVFEDEILYNSNDE